MNYEKEIKTRLDNGNGLVIRIPKPMADIMNLGAKQKLRIKLMDNCKGFIVTVQDYDNAGD